MGVPKNPLFARIPENVLADPELTGTDIRVFGFMATQCLRTNLFSLGQVKLAELAHVDRRTLRRSLEALSRRGHISRAIGRLSKRTVYQLNSPVFLSTAEFGNGAPVRQSNGAPVRQRFRVESIRGRKTL